MNRSVLVTTTIDHDSGSDSHTRIWDGKEPLPIGSPLRWVLERVSDGVRLRNLTGQPHLLCTDSTKIILSASIQSGVSLSLTPEFALRISAVTVRPKTALPTSECTRARDPGTQLFKRSLQATCATLLIALTLSGLWPKEENLDLPLIPPQFAKIVLSRTHKSKTASNSAPAVNSATQASEQSKKMAQALRNQALRGAIKGLLKGGITKLLAQSDFATGSRAATGAKIFDTKSGSLRSVEGISRKMGRQTTQISALGGAPGAKNSVGYSQGIHASVLGQGRSHIAMDTGASQVEEGLTKDEVGEVIHRHISEVRYCYESAIVRQSDTEGKLVIGFTIAGSGRVKTTAVHTSTLPDPRLDDCILRRLVTWKFPEPKGGVEVAVSYPFLFKTLGR